MPLPASPKRSARRAIARSSPAQAARRLARAHRATLDRALSRSALAPHAGIPTLTEPLSEPLYPASPASTAAQPCAQSARAPWTPLALIGPPGTRTVLFGAAALCCALAWACHAMGLGSAVMFFCTGAAVCCVAGHAMARPGALLSGPAQQPGASVLDAPPPVAR